MDITRHRARGARLAAHRGDRHVKRRRTSTIVADLRQTRRRHRGVQHDQGPPEGAIWRAILASACSSPTRDSHAMSRSAVASKSSTIPRSDCSA